MRNSARMNCFNCGGRAIAAAKAVEELPDSTRERAR